MSKITLSISLNEAKILYREATIERKLELEELFPELKYNNMENYKQIKTYEDALKVLGKEDFNHENLYPREIARRKLEIIIEALNEGWKPDWKNYSQLKWYPYFHESSDSIKCTISINSPTNTTTYINTHLCCKDEKTADYAGRQFLDLYQEVFLG